MTDNQNVITMRSRGPADSTESREAVGQHEIERVLEARLVSQGFNDDDDLPIQSGRGSSPDGVVFMTGWTPTKDGWIDIKSVEGEFFVSLYVVSDNSGEWALIDVHAGMVKRVRIVDAPLRLTDNGVCAEWSLGAKDKDGVDIIVPVIVLSRHVNMMLVPANSPFVDGIAKAHLNRSWWRMIVGHVVFGVARLVGSLNEIRQYSRSQADFHAVWLRPLAPRRFRLFASQVADCVATYGIRYARASVTGVWERGSGLVGVIRQAPVETFAYVRRVGEEAQRRLSIRAAAATQEEIGMLGAGASKGDGPECWLCGQRSHVIKDCPAVDKAEAYIRLKEENDEDLDREAQEELERKAKLGHSFVENARLLIDVRRTEKQTIKDAQKEFTEGIITGDELERKLTLWAGVVSKHEMRCRGLARDLYREDVSNIVAPGADVTAMPADVRPEPPCRAHIDPAVEAWSEAVRIASDARDTAYHQSPAESDAEDVPVEILPEPDEELSLPPPHDPPGGGGGGGDDDDADGPVKCLPDPADDIHRSLSLSVSNFTDDSMTRREAVFLPLLLVCGLAGFVGLLLAWVFWPRCEVPSSIQGLFGPLLERVLRISMYEFYALYSACLFGARLLVYIAQDRLFMVGVYVTFTIASYVLTGSFHVTMVTSLLMYCRALIGFIDPYIGRIWRDLDRVLWSDIFATPLCIMIAGFTGAFWHDVVLFLMERLTEIKPVDLFFRAGLTEYDICMRERSFRWPVGLAIVGACGVVAAAYATKRWFVRRVVSYERVRALRGNSHDDRDLATATRNAMIRDPKLAIWKKTSTTYNWLLPVTDVGCVVVSEEIVHAVNSIRVATQVCENAELFKKQQMRAALDNLIPVSRQDQSALAIGRVSVEMAYHLIMSRLRHEPPVF